ncbi:hypothetical protein [Novosphingobium sp. Gsoil 351]|uniref:hypothetical protein n=1 Tax=Novosphingobium sp. Gsoil 351 TaxID=2675225 RepID=UPI001E3D9B78|nr:hypothetical protein [Novosphingobium sp. Gsoil 351]
MLLIETSRCGESGDTEVQQFSVKPIGVPSGATAVTIVIPVAKQPIGLSGSSENGWVAERESPKHP